MATPATTPMTIPAIAPPDSEDPPPASEVDVVVWAPVVAVAGDEVAEVVDVGVEVLVAVVIVLDADGARCTSNASRFLLESFPHGI